MDHSIKRASASTGNMAFDPLPALSGPVMTDIPTPRVPARLVLASLAALWICYFLVATLRGAFMGFDFGWPIISRRLTICILSMLAMAAMWPVLQLFDRKPFGVRLAVVLIGALPMALGLSLINQAIFADMQAKIGMSDKEHSERSGTDEAGNILSDLPDRPAPPRPPLPGATEVAPPPPPSPPAPSGEEKREKDNKVTIHTDEADVVSPKAEAIRWAIVADTAFGRYFLVLAWAALYFALAKAEEARAAERREGEYRRAAAAAELRSLRYQVNPHFLFNTLNSLSALVMTGRQDDAEAMIQSLSTFYRHTLSGDPTGDLPLMDEIELQKLYLAIESVRFPNRLKTRIEVDDDVANAMVPGMILQPIVENSVKYAVSATQEPVTIAISATRDGDMLRVTVSDDGPGGKPSGVKGCGIGLGNVRDRLRARFGSAAQLEFGKRDGRGFESVLHIPLSRGLELPA